MELLRARVTYCISPRCRFYRLKLVQELARPRPRPREALLCLPRLPLELDEQVGVLDVGRDGHHLGVAVEEQLGVVHLRPHFSLAIVCRLLQPHVCQEPPILIPLAYIHSFR